MGDGRPGKQSQGVSGNGGWQMSSRAVATEGQRPPWKKAFDSCFQAKDLILKTTLETSLFQVCECF